ncbi:FecR domain-containing protein [Candidatus Peregrinibacteria bacterium]|nr:FecR domain-containing protein [Candidatus Peregrinibacteria bacterium]
MYYKRPPRKRFYSYLMPFLVIVLIFAGIVFGWRALNDILIDQNRSTSNEKVFLNIESGSAKAMTVGKSEWQNAPDKIYLYRGERFKTGADGRATFTFFDQSLMRLNTNTEVTFTSLKKKNDTYNIEVELVRGDVWTKVERITNPGSTFGITTGLITVDSRGGVIAISAPGTVYMLEGTAQIGVKYEDDVIKTYTLGVGQQFLVDEAKAQAIERGEDTEVIFALSDSFKQTNWYRWNIKKDGAVNAFEESDLGEEGAETAEGLITEDEEAGGGAEDLANVGRVAYVTKPSKDTETNKSTLTVEGNFDPEKINAIYVEGQKAAVTGTGKWKADSVKLTFEGENEIDIEAEQLDGIKTALEPLVVVYDKTAPDTPAITDPGANDETVEIEDIEQIIKGTVSKDTAAVIVNDYRLTKYVPGSGTFEYYAKTEYGNLEVGDNEYKVIAEDKAGNQSESAIINLTLTQEVVDEAGNKDEASVETQDPASQDDEDELPQASSSGGVVITAPNGGESFTTSETEFEITGTVPDGTAKVEVNDYALSLFEPGNTNFKYRAFVSIGNLKIGEKNTYTVKAYDEDGGVLGEASITIDVESGASSAPVITIPTSSGSYATTLDTLVVGGTVGKWVTRMYVDNKEITDYIPGSEQWRMSIKLNPGKNTIVVTAEKAGEQVGKAEIEITYNP